MTLTPTHAGLIPLILFLLIVLGGAGAFCWQSWRKYRVLKACQPVDRTSQAGRRFRGIVDFVLGQKRLLMDPLPGWQHVAIFYGFCILAAGNLLLFAEVFCEPCALFLRGIPVLFPLFQLAQDILAFAVFVGVTIGLWRRLISKPKRLHFSIDGVVILLLILTIVSCHFLYNGAIAKLNDQGTVWAPVSMLFTGLWTALGVSDGGLLTGYQVTWWLHLLCIFAFLAYLPTAKHYHVALAPLNVYLRDLRPVGIIEKMDIENLESFGVSKVEELSWKQVLDGWVCTECGRCDEHCPAFQTGKPLSPQQIILGTTRNLMDNRELLLAPPDKREALEGQRKPLIGEGCHTEDALWSCTTCHSCVTHCPVFNEHLERIVAMRQNLVLMESRFPPELTSAFKNMENNGNPWSFPPQTRADWRESAGVTVPLLEEAEETPEVLWWVGCANSYDDRAQKVSGAFARLLRRAGVKYAILGSSESCCGDPARRAGNEYLFQMLAMQNVETLQATGIKRIVTACPHCYNIFAKEYPPFGLEVEVIHHSLFLRELISEGRLQVSSSARAALTYHDPCYLGRYNERYDEPRDLLRRTGHPLREMERSGVDALCCGAGGGRMYMEETLGTRINTLRFSQCRESGADGLAVSCPYCLTMMTDAAKDAGVEETFPVRDVAEWLEESIGKM